MVRHDGDPVQILRYVQGDLNDEELAEFSHHLRVCSQCQARVEQERALSGLFQKTASLYTAPAELHARVAASLASELHSRRTLRTKILAGAGLIGEILKPQHSGTRRLLPVLGAMLIAVVCVRFFHILLQESRAGEYVQAAVAAHRDTLDGQHPIEIQSNAPETVTRWAGQRVPSTFSCPSLRMFPREAQGSSWMEHG